MVKETYEPIDLVGTAVPVLPIEMEVEATPQHLICQLCRYELKEEVKNVSESFISRSDSHVFLKVRTSTHLRNN